MYFLPHCLSGSLKRWKIKYGQKDRKIEREWAVLAIIIDKCSVKIVYRFIINIKAAILNKWAQFTIIIYHNYIYIENFTFSNNLRLEGIKVDIKMRRNFNISQLSLWKTWTQMKFNWVVVIASREVASTQILPGNVRILW